MINDTHTYEARKRVMADKTNRRNLLFHMCISVYVINAHIDVTGGAAKVGRGVGACVSA